MDDVIVTAFTPLIGLHCWGVGRGHGSILTFEFGSPRLLVREPYVSTSPSATARQNSSRRRVKPVGEWCLFVLCCHWRITETGAPLADDESAHVQIEAAARALDGQKLAAVMLDAATRETIFTFDLGATLTTWPYDADSEEQWSLYLPYGQVLTYRADGRYSLGPGDESPDRVVWHASGRSLVLP